MLSRSSLSGAVLLMIFLLGFVRFNGSAQIIVKPGEQPSNYKIENIRQYYDSLFRSDLKLIDGRLHTERYPIGKGDAFFISAESVPGTIAVGNKLYKYNLIRYDLLNDFLQIHYFSPTGSYILDLNDDKVDAFTIHGHSFYRLVPGRIPGFPLPEGFYELKYNGQCNFWLRYEKTFSSRTVETSGSYSEVIRRYIYRDKIWYRITNRRSLLKVFPGHEDEIKEYLRNSNITVNIASDDQIVSVIRFFESISGNR